MVSFAGKYVLFSTVASVTGLFGFDDLCNSCSIGKIDLNEFIDVLGVTRT